VSARCHDEQATFLALNVMNDIVPADPRRDVVGAETHPSRWPGLSSPNPIALPESFERVQESPFKI
jgi:hypothetical protein